MRITANQIARAYEYAQKAYKGEMTNAEAASYLTNHYGVNPNTAIDFVSGFRHIMNGHEYKRGLSIPVIEYFLEHIVSDYGTPALINALAALMANIEYEEDSKSTSRPGPRRIHAKFCKQLQN